MNSCWGVGWALEYLNETEQTWPGAKTCHAQVALSACEEKRSCPIRVLPKVGIKQIVGIRLALV